VEFKVYEKVANVIIASPGKIRIPQIDRAIAQEEDISASGGLPIEARSLAERESEIAPGRTIRR